MKIKQRWTRVGGDDRGMSTVEYAIGTLAAAAFAMVLMKVLTSGTVSGRLTTLIANALAGSF